jgi:hypothetical protein
MYGTNSPVWEIIAVTPDMKEPSIESYADIENQVVREELILKQKKVNADIVSFIREDGADLYTVHISPRPVRGLTRFAYERRRVDLLKILSDIGKCSVTHGNAYEFLLSTNMKFILNRTGPTDASLMFQYSPDDGPARSNTVLIGHAVLDVNRGRSLATEEMFIDNMAHNIRKIEEYTKEEKRSSTTV